jgi:hypothetical protein
MIRYPPFENEVSITAPAHYQIYGVIVSRLIIIINAAALPPEKENIYH